MRRMTAVEGERVRKYAYPSAIGRLAEALLRNRRVVRHRRGDFRMDYERGEVQVLRGVVREIAQGDEWNDEGPIYLLGFGDGDWVWLCGPWLYDPCVVAASLLRWFEDRDDTVWPDIVQVERLPTTGLALSLRGLSPRPVVVSKLIAHADIYYLGESHLFTGSFETLEADLEEAFRAASRLLE